MMTRIVFMGSPEFAVPVLRELANRYLVAGVVTQPDRRAGRGRGLKSPPVKLAAQDLNLEVAQPQKLATPQAMDKLRQWAPDLIAVAAFGQILRREVLALPVFGCINVHASLLPRWRGAAPIQAAIAAGDAETGVTIMKMDEGLDTGAILAQQRVEIDVHDTGGSLSEKLSVVGADLLIRTLPEYVAGSLQPVPQDEARATYAPRLKKDDGHLEFSSPADVLARRVRALRPWPGTFMVWNGERLNVLSAHAEPGNAHTGQRIVFHEQLAVGTANGLLILDEVQPAGRKAMDGRSFLLGARTWAG